MENKDALNILASLLAEKQREVDALNIAMDILTNGYKSDQAVSAVAADVAEDIEQP